VYYNQATLLGGNWSNGKFLLDHNLYWNASGSPVVFPGGLSLEKWQAKEQDVHSLIADPKFADAAKCDFRLQADSPAAKIGFEPFDISAAGLTGPRDWVGLPKQVQRPKMLLPGEK
jgi:hypothetical protein